MKVEVVNLPNISSTITYYIGRDASDNFKIIDLAQPDDIWVHAKSISSCHVIAIIPEQFTLSKKQIITIIKKGASLCQKNTNKLINEKNIEFTYTQVKNVMKTERVGEVIVTNEKNIFVNERK
jgi:predicted ribosome quality control (RQC) complex YloA/Tae2 family protein